jgi:HK97 family phage prohead protease
MTVQRKSFPVEIKTDGLPKGQVEALVSVFGNVDLGGDRVMKGAFAGSIARWKASGDTVPVVFSHKWDDPWAHIGAVTDLEETEAGLKATYTLDVDDNPLAAHIHRLMKRRSLKEHSFAYTVSKSKTGEDGATELHDLDIIEVGPTLKGMNPDTELLSVKAAAWDALESERDDPAKTSDEGRRGDAPRALTVTHDELKALVAAAVAEHFRSSHEAGPEKADEAGDVKSVEDEGVTASDPELLSLQRQLNELRS